MIFASSTRSVTSNNWKSCTLLLLLILIVLLILMMITIRALILTNTRNECMNQLGFANSAACVRIRQRLLHSNHADVQLQTRGDDLALFAHAQGRLLALLLQQLLVLRLRLLELAEKKVVLRLERRRGGGGVGVGTAIAHFGWQLEMKHRRRIRRW